MQDRVGECAPVRPIPASAGIGLRSPHHRLLLEQRPGIGWLEAHTENYFHDGGPHLTALLALREHYPLSLHGVGLGLGSVEPIDNSHLARVRNAVSLLQPALISEHACWSQAGGEHFNDLLPLPYTEEAVDHLAARIRHVQDILGRQILMENLSSYVTFRHSTLTEAEFLAGLVERSECGLLLDVNNAYVNACNHGLDADEFVASLPAAAVQEIHLAGHLRHALGQHTVLIDDHGSAVAPEVWQLYARTIARLGPRPTLIEWDTNIPELGILLREAAHAEQLLQRAHEQAA